MRLTGRDALGLKFDPGAELLGGPGPARPGSRMTDHPPCQLRGATMSFIAELWRFMRVRKKYWLLPVVLMMALFGGLIVLTQGSAVAPFIYTIF